MPLRDHWWCILVAKYGAFLFTEIGAFVITDYTKIFIIGNKSDINIRLSRLIWYISKS